MNNSSVTHQTGNLHPSDWPNEQGTIDGKPLYYRFDLTSCYSDTGQCTVNPDWERLVAETACPNGSPQSGTTYSNSNGSELV
ncbi:MAG TPA: hypothetical protein VGC34_18135, partial [Steroidobacteraceae bacterium]